MSASYWTSTQRSMWTFSKQELAKERNKLWIMESQAFPEGLTVPMVNNSQNNASSGGSTKGGEANGVVNDPNQGSNGSGGSGGRIVSKHVSIFSKDLHYDKDFSLRIYCYFLMMKLGRRLNLRQQALSTANVYLSRFLLKVSVREVNLYLLITTCIYLACKVEECPLHIRSLVNEARANWPEFISADATKVTEFEFYLIEELGSYLIIHHPYQSLEQIMNCFNKKYSNYSSSSATELLNKTSLASNGSIEENNVAILGLNDKVTPKKPELLVKPSDGEDIVLENRVSNSDSDDDKNNNNNNNNNGQEDITIDAEIYQNTWSLINDSYITDVHLLYPPHVIAVACLMIALSSSYSPPSQQHLKTKTKSPSPSKKTEIKNKKILKHLQVFLAESLIDIELVMHCCEELLMLYDHWEKYNEDWTRYLLYHVYLVKR